MPKLHVEMFYYAHGQNGSHSEDADPEATPDERRYFIQSADTIGGPVAALRL
jgi:hypothetical protein